MPFMEMVRIVLYNETKAKTRTSIKFLLLVRRDIFSTMFNLFFFPYFIFKKYNLTNCFFLEKLILSRKRVFFYSYV
jgi:hypothetical protein